jgi:type IV pilus assembly protein PilY1
MTRPNSSVALASLLLVSLAGASAPSHAALNIAEVPLFISVPVDPNLMFIMDDSGSMHFETLPDAITMEEFGGGWAARSVMYTFPMKGAGTPAGVSHEDCIYSDTTADHCDYWRSSGYRAERLHVVPRFAADDKWAAFYRSAHNNPLYYNPTIRYRPWVKADRTYWANSTPAAAPHNPQRPAKGTRNLTINNKQRACWLDSDASTADSDANLCTTGDLTFFPATYFVYGGSGNVRDVSNYSRVEIKSGNAPFAGGAGRTDCADPNACTFNEEIQNFANWYTYHRSRILASQAGIGAAFAQLPERMRIGFGAINKGSTTIDGVATRTLIQGVRRFEGAGRTGFFDLLYGHNWPLASTPLRRALDDAGRYLMRTDDQGPWSSTPGLTGGSELSCRQSFTVLMTDGAWNGDQASTAAARANNDGTAGPTITGPDDQSHTYAAVAPFSDSASNTLADVAMHYWKNDLRTDLPNRVPASSLNPAFWQHMVTFGVALGLHGSIVPETAFAAIGTGASVAWPATVTDSSSSEDRLDDLLHASVNGRGGFFSAGDPGTFAEGLVNVLRDVIARTGSVTGLTVSSTRLTTGSKIFAAQFSSEDWSGDLRAHDPATYDQVWSAAEQLEDLGHSARNIWTFDGSEGVAFDGSLANPIKLAIVAPLGLDPAAASTLTVAGRIIAYLRGDRSNEQSAGGTFRNRDSLLGDIVNARPFFATSGNEGWARLPTAAGGGSSGIGSYGEYLDKKKRDPRPCAGQPGCTGDRYDAVYVGANDGMLHAFDARTGDELFAYVPSAVHGKLHRLTSPSYGHAYFVDGDITIADAYLDGQWRSVLVGSLGAGGRGIYALDVSAPQSFDGSSDKKHVLWEFTAEDDEDLGFTFGEPAITRLKNGTWVAIFGNGYNSANGRAYLYVVNLANGILLQKVALGTQTDNGLSGVAISLDTASRTHVSRVYAGDLRGRVWRVDFNESLPSVAFAGGLFTDPDGRPITSRPTLAASPAGGMLVYVGTGKLIEPDDRLNTSPALERFWALHDRNAAIANNNLNSFGKVTLAAATGGVRTASSSYDATKNGWYVNLRVPDAAAGNSGERVLERPQVMFGRVLFSTYEPLNDPCMPGGRQRLYVLNAISGTAAFGGAGGDAAGRVIGTGAPADPPMVIVPRPPGGGGGRIDPDDPGPPEPDPDDPDPVDPDEPTLPPAGTTGSRSGWCEELSIPLPEGGRVILGTLCNGRQVWRQVR